jgi:hypothetical protein
VLATEPPIALSQRASVRPGETRRVAISQSNYIPWKGYFDFINSVDEFIILDDVTYQARLAQPQQAQGAAGAFGSRSPFRSRGGTSRRSTRRRSPTRTGHPITGRRSRAFTPAPSVSTPTETASGRFTHSPTWTI